MSVSRAEIHEALQCLYDNVKLAEVSLLDHCPAIASISDMALRAQKLRSLLVESIESLQPPRSRSFRCPSTRSYQVIALRYLEEMPMARVARELHISERQAYRDLVQAEECLTELVSSRIASSNPQERPSSLRDEVDQFTSHPTHLDVVVLTHEVLEIVSPLARVHRVSFTTDWDSEATYAYAHPTLLRQTLVQTLSLATTLSEAGIIRISSNRLEKEIQICVRFRTLSSKSTLSDKFRPVRNLSLTQKLYYDIACGSDQWATVCISLPQVRKVAMIVEDNSSAVELYRRFLADRREWGIISTPGASEVCELAARYQPSLIVLDILLPQQDGWAVLQKLKTHPETSGIPVLVCSVFEELELANVLGASGYLTKPVSHLEFLQALDRLTLLG